MSLTCSSDGRNIMTRPVPLHPEQLQVLTVAQKLILVLLTMAMPTAAWLWTAMLLTATRSWRTCRPYARFGVSLLRTPWLLLLCRILASDSCHARGRDQDGPDRKALLRAGSDARGRLLPGLDIIAKKYATTDPPLLARMVKESSRSGRPYHFIKRRIVHANTDPAVQKRLPLPRPCWALFGCVPVPPPVPSPGCVMVEAATQSRGFDGGLRLADVVKENLAL